MVFLTAIPFPSYPIPSLNSGMYTSHHLLCIYKHTNSTQTQTFFFLYEWDRDKQIDVKLDFPLNWHILDIFPCQHIHIWIFTFNWCIESYCKRHHNKFTQSPIDGRFGCFQSFAIINEAVVNTLVHTCLCALKIHWTRISKINLRSVWRQVLEDRKLVTLGKGQCLERDTTRVSRVLAVFCSLI